jgi:hypothetical protein
MNHHCSEIKWIAICLTGLAFFGMIFVSVLSSNAQFVSGQLMSTPPQFSAIPNGSTFYVQEHDDLTINLSAASSGVGTVTISAPILPGGATFNTSAPANPATGMLTWNDVGPVGGYSATFTASDTNGNSSSLEVLIIVEDSSPVPAISLNRQEFLPGDQIVVNLSDSHADRIYGVQESTSVEVSSDTDPVGFTVNLVENEDVAGTFVGSFSLSRVASTGKLTVTPGDTISIRYGSNTFTTKVASEAIRLDRTIYATDDTVRITVIDAAANTSGFSVEEVTVKVTSPQGMVTVHPKETGANTGIFEHVLNLSGTTSGVNTLQVVANDTILAAYDGKNKNANARIDFPLTIFFDREKYTEKDLAQLRVIDVKKNLDPLSAETISVSLNSSVNPTGFAITLRETDLDTGRFGSPNFIQFSVNGTDNNDTVIEVNVGEGISSTVTATYDNEKAEVSIIYSEDQASSAGAGESGGYLTEGMPITTAAVVDCSVYPNGGDTDHDGICNQWEYGSGLKIYYNGKWHYFTASDVSYPQFPTSSFPDILVEVDYFNGWRPYHDGTSSPFAKGYAALEKARTELSSKARLHWVVNENVGSHSSLRVWSGNQASDPQEPGYFQIKEVYFGTAADRQKLSTSPDQLKAKWQVYHYVLYANHQSSDFGSSGNAEILGNDAVVSLEAFAPGGLTAGTLNIETGTLLHELGHNLGLDHGGGFDPAIAHPSTGFPAWISDHAINCKPNYPSVMSYVRQIPSNYGVSLNDLKLYSEGKLSELNMMSLQESAGLRTSGTWAPKVAYGVGPSPSIRDIMVGDTYMAPPQIGINWDGQSGSDTTSNSELVNLGFYGCHHDNAVQAVNLGGTLRDHNDLQGIVLDFRTHNPAVFVNGVYAKEEHKDLDVDTWNFITKLETMDMFMFTATYGGVQYAIGGLSETVSAGADTFVINAAESLDEIEIQGEGRVELLIQKQLMEPGWELETTTVYVDGTPLQPSAVAKREATERLPHISLEFDVLGNGPHTVKIMNVKVIPEFPTTLVVLTVAILAIIGLTSAMRGNGVRPFYGGVR